MPDLADVYYDPATGLPLSAPPPEEPVKKPLKRPTPYAPPTAVPGLAESMSRATVELPPAQDDQAVDWSKLNQPFGELKPSNPSPSERIRGNVQDAMIAGGASPYNAGKLADILMSLAQIPLGVPLGAADTVHYKNQDDIGGTVQAAIGMIPGAKAGTRAVRKTAAEIKAIADRAEASALAKQKGSPVPAAAAEAPTTGEKLASEVENSRAVIGGNNPPPDVPPPPVDVPKLEKFKRSTDVPDIRDRPRDEAIAYARQEPHLIKAGDQSDGFYVGGPRSMTSRRDLSKARKDFDAYVAADPRGGDWYDRYRPHVAEVTGGNPVDIEWMRKQHGQWSAGVDPGSEQHFVLKENNASLAGMPTRANYPAQHEAHLAAIEAKDPNRYQLGEKTGEYADLINPIRPPYVGATGVNDFRHARNWGYTETSGEAQKGALTDAGHKFLDYETALAVDRANKAKLGGRDDWTGEKLQAAPWVRQKALDIQGRNKNLSYDEAFKRANRTIADYADKHTAFATHEAQPGAAGAGHMPESVNASLADRLAYASDPKSSWANAPGGRDAIYSELRLPGTGVAMRVRPTIEMQGMFEGPRGLETNPGFAARPQVTFDTSTDAFKTITPHDKALLNAGEAVRAFIDAQEAGGWHKLWFGGPARESRSLFFPRTGKSTPQELLDVQKQTSPNELTNAVDTGQGVTATRFYPKLEDVPKGEKDKLGDAMRKGLFDNVVPGSKPQRARVDSDMVDYSDKWTEGTGSGAATRKLLEYVTATPEIRTVFNNNPLIAQNAMNRLLRDEQWAAKWGAPREDIQNARRIIAGASNSRDWIDKLEAALKKGAISLPAVAAIVGSAAYSIGAPEGSPANEGL